MIIRNSSVNTSRKRPLADITQKEKSKKEKSRTDLDMILGLRRQFDAKIEEARKRLREVQLVFERVRRKTSRFDWVVFTLQLQSVQDWEHFLYNVLPSMILSIESKTRPYYTPLNQRQYRLEILSELGVLNNFLDILELRLLFHVTHKQRESIVRQSMSLPSLPIRRMR